MSHIYLIVGCVNFYQIEHKLISDSHIYNYEKQLTCGIRFLLHLQIATLLVRWIKSNEKNIPTG